MWAGTTVGIRFQKLLVKMEVIGVFVLDGHHQRWTVGSACTLLAVHGVQLFFTP